MTAGTTTRKKITLRRVSRTPTSLSTLEVFVDGTLCITATGNALANHNLGTNSDLILGGDGAAYTVPLSVDDVRIESVTAPTNDLADGAGILVAGDGQINSKVADRSITWKKNAGQELGDQYGSYWHIKGGQLMFSRMIDSTLRKAPGTNVLLSSLPTKSTTGTTTEPHYWRLSAPTGSGPYQTADIGGGTPLVPLQYTASGASSTFLGEWFNRDSTNPTSVANFGSGTATNFTLPSGGEPVGGAVSLPAASGANTRFVQMVDYNPTGTFGNGYGHFTIEAKVKSSVANQLTNFLIFTVGDDASGPVRVAIISSVHNLTNPHLILTTDNGGGSSDDKNLYVPYSALSAAFAAASTTYTGNPNDGAYHVYRLYRKDVNFGTTSDPTQLFSFWYDDVQIPLTVGSNGLFLSPNAPLYNPQITGARAFIRIGNTTRTATAQAAVLDYVRYMNGQATVTPAGAPNHSGGFFQTMYGNPGYVTSYYSANGINRAGTGLMVVGVVKPITSFAATGGVYTSDGAAMTAPFLCGVAGSTNTNVDMVELLTIGNIATAGQYVSVWAWRGGRILIFNGTSYNQTANAVSTSTSEFVLGIHIESTPIAGEIKLYINGFVPAMAGWRTITGNVTGAGNVSTLSLSATASQRVTDVERHVLPSRQVTSRTALRRRYILWTFVVALSESMPEMEVNPSDRATAIALRTYHRPLDDGSGGLESWDQVVARVIDHQRWLWIRAKDAPLTADEEKELDELSRLILNRRIAPAGRTLVVSSINLRTLRCP
eukprot:jgi/Mesvir1/1661/Mv02151-RA.1